MHSSKKDVLYEWACSSEKRKVKKRLMAHLIDMLKEDFGIDHATIQLEDEDYPKAMSELDKKSAKFIIVY